MPPFGRIARKNDEQAPWANRLDVKDRRALSGRAGARARGRAPCTPSGVAEDPPEVLYGLQRVDASPDSMLFTTCSLLDIGLEDTVSNFLVERNDPAELTGATVRVAGVQPACSSGRALSGTLSF